MPMTLIRTLTAFALGLSAFGALAQTVVGVSWSNFQEERWKTDEAAIKASRQKIPVVAYDRLIEAPGVFYITFDNVEVGRMQAREVFKVAPKGNYVFIKGSPSDPNANFLRAGAQEVVDAAVKKGESQSSLQEREITATGTFDGP